ncbi:hypothetical protein NUW54_g10735 [Trametes sanguinea]|uniref:Uncharacterized protein n=1 Tax=Trametes sanguinea TaxID=158606 RepID=A0ACC1NT98_9APHY|nr:hypothetical protein NUW54_g10735 [Trametes sanguinea]
MLIMHAKNGSYAPCGHTDHPIAANPTRVLYRSSIDLSVFPADTRDALSRRTTARRAGRDESSFVYLKDCWRVLHERSALEGDILLHLNDKRVKNIPTALYHGDVEDHRTISQEFCKCARSGCVAESIEIAEERLVEEMLGEERDEAVVNTSDEYVEETLGKLAGELSGEAADETSAHASCQSVEEEDAETGEGPSTDAPGPGLSSTTNSRCCMKAHRHYRLVVKEVGLPLQEFPCGGILVWAIRDAVKAHEDAYKKARVMHRDISVGNILIIPPNHKNKKSTYQGLLADWELSKGLDDYKVKARHPDRTGTWQFMSVYIQDHPEAQVLISDELESFVHVMLYCAVRYLPHTAKDVADFMYHYFDDGVREAGTEYTCGMLKRKVMKEGVVTTRRDTRIIFLRRPRDPNAKPTVPSNVPKKDQHPINDILAPLLDCFTARYQLLDPKFNEPTDNESDSDSEDDDSESDDSSSQSDNPPVVVGDALRVQKLLLRLNSKRIESHKYMIKLLKKASYKKAHRWPGPEDRTADQLDPDFNPNKTPKTHEKRSAPEPEAQEQPASKRHRSAASRA